MPSASATGSLVRAAHEIGVTPLDPPISNGISAATGRPGIVHCSHAFHGLTYGSLSVNGDEVFRAGFGPLLPECVEVPFNDLGALERVSAERLSDIERVEKAVGRARVVDRRQVARNVSRELYCRIVEIVRSQICRRGKAPGFERGLPILGAQQLLGSLHADLAPGGHDDVAGSAVGHRNVFAIRQCDGKVGHSRFGQKPPRFRA